MRPVPDPAPADPKFRPPADPAPADPAPTKGSEAPRKPKKKRKGFFDQVDEALFGSDDDDDEDEDEDDDESDDDEDEDE